MSRIPQLESLLKDSPDDPFLNHAMALEYVKLGDDQKARSLFEGILSSRPGYVGSYYHLAKLYERMEETELAVKTYERGIVEAHSAGDSLSEREMRAALEELIF
jgi:tetratricopeptide (TPR) repeat protein